MIRRFRTWLRVHWKLALTGAFILAIAGTAVFVTGVTVWEYTNSTEFCGETCHTMPPEYIAYQKSPHARVSCVDCHLGQDSVLEAIPRKAKEVRHVVYALTQDYEIPIYVRSLRPARDTCEKCHSPEKSSLDSVKRIERYQLDADNTPIRTYLTLKTGGGVDREGQGRGIHWHITNEVYYLANDELKQDIPYVKEVLNDGTVREYYDLESGITPEQVAARSEELRRMDCIDCHNRVSHKFESPDNAVDDAINSGLIDATLPEIKAKATEALNVEGLGHEEASAQIGELATWYEQNYPEVYAEKQPQIDQTITVLQEIFGDIYFPDMKVGWETHPDNIGHKDFPGCFRCHDGKHTSPAGETIRLECNVCHTIPRVSGPGLPAPTINLEPTNEPESHKDSNWLARHREEFDETCAGCHSTFNRGGSDNSSFCANGACHGTNWKFAGLDAPGLRAILPPVTEATDVPTQEVNQGEGSGFVPYIPHPLSEERIGQCKTCHGMDGIEPYPQWHEEEQFPLTVCTDCHQLAPAVRPTPAP